MFILFLFDHGTPAPLQPFLVLNYRFIAYEERTMAERFGEEYLRYQRRTPRWV